jgi:phosphate:Na+ symporter
MWISSLLFVLYGFGIFLCGMKLMELALHRLAGPYLDKTLQRFTATPLRGMAVGAAASAALQSSTAVTVVSIGMVNARLLSFSRTLGIVLGTNIGTCLTTELIGLNISHAAAPMLGLSAILWLFTVLGGEMNLIAIGGRRAWLKSLRSASLALAGFSLLLMGLSMMQSIGPDIQNSGVYDWFLGKSATSLWWGLAAGIALTAAVHSSAAVIGMVMGFVMLGAMPPELGVAIVLGANIGTCSTALLAGIGGTREGRFVAYAHTVLNIGGALLFMPLIGELTLLSDWLSHSPSSLVARAQTIFNVACSLLALPFCYLSIWNRVG